MSWPQRNLKQTITYWAPSTPDGFGGRTFSTPVQIRGRWEERTELVRSFSGEETLSTNRVFLASAVLPGGYLMLGTSTAASPATTAAEIISVTSTPTLNADYFEYKAFLK